MLDVIEDCDEHLVFGHAEGGRVGVFVCAIVYDSVHVEVETIKFGNAILGDHLRNGRVPLAEPAEKFGNTHGCW